MKPIFIPSSGFSVADGLALGSLLSLGAYRKEHPYGTA
jgi:hypothetical protein